MSVFQTFLWFYSFFFKLSPLFISSNPWKRNTCLKALPCRTLLLNLPTMFWGKLSSSCLIAGPTRLLFSLSWMLVVGSVTKFKGGSSLWGWSSRSSLLCDGPVSVDASLLVYLDTLKIYRLWVTVEGCKRLITGSQYKFPTDLSLVIEAGFLCLSRLELEETWELSHSDCKEFSSADVDDRATWLDTALLWGISSWLFRPDWLELPLDPRCSLRRGVGIIPADPGWASNPRPLLSDGLRGRLERKVLFFGTGLKPTEEPSDVWLASPAGWFFSGETGSEDRKDKRLTAGYPQIAPQRSVCSNFSSDLSPVTPGLDWLTGNDYFQEAQQQQGKHG